jgi:bifunctional non-homologous end joining protein LigD
MSKVPEARRSSARFLARMVPGAAAAPVDFVAPCRTVTKRSPPRSRGWVHEILFQGLRLQARVEKGRVALRDTEGPAESRALRRIAAGFSALPVNRVLVDGVAVVQSAGGASDRAALAAALAAAHGERIVFFAFDLLHLDGFDIRAASLVERKRVLAALLGEAGTGTIAFSGHVEGEGRDFLSEVEALGLAGMVSKRADAPYRSGPCGDWLAVPIRQKPRPA